MFINHKLIDENTFVLVMDNGDEFTYKTNNTINNLDVFSLVFTQNELEYRNKKLRKLYDEKRNLKINLLRIKKDLYMKKRLQRNIKDTENDINRLHGRLDQLRNEINPSIVSMEPKKLSKRISK